MAQLQAEGKLTEAHASLAKAFTADLGATPLQILQQLIRLRTFLLRLHYANQKDSPFEIRFPFRGERIDFHDLAGDLRAAANHLLYPQLADVSRQ